VSDDIDVKICEDKIVNEQFLRFTPLELIEVSRFPKQFFYSKNFIKKVYELSVHGELHLPRLADDLQKLASNEPLKMKRGGKFKGEKLNKYNLRHIHYQNGAALKDNFLKILLSNYGNMHVKHLNEALVKSQEELFSKKYWTGEWIVYKEYKENFYFLDICKHGSDTLIENNVVKVYAIEFPELFEL